MIDRLTSGAALRHATCDLTSVTDNMHTVVRPRTIRSTRGSRVGCERPGAGLGCRVEPVKVDDMTYWYRKSWVGGRLGFKINYLRIVVLSAANENPSDVGECGAEQGRAWSMELLGRAGV